MNYTKNNKQYIMLVYANNTKLRAWFLMNDVMNAKSCKFWVQIQKWLHWEQGLNVYQGQVGVQMVILSMILMLKLLLEEL